MANTRTTLQCIEAIKKRSRAPSTKKIKAVGISPPDLRHETKARQKVSKNKLYDIKILDDRELKCTIVDIAPSMRNGDQKQK